MITRLPKRADFGLSRGGGLAMFVVRLGTWSQYGHCAVVEYDPFKGRDDVWYVNIIEAYPGGCRRRTARVDEFDWSNLTLSDAQRTAIVSYCQDCLGIPYDWPAIAGFLVRFWWAGFTNQSGDHGDDKLICSEMAVWAYREGAEVDLRPGRAPGDVPPARLSAWVWPKRRPRVRLLPFI